MAADDRAQMNANGFPELEAQSESWCPSKWQERFRPD
jgi:hypothetical protein